MRRLVNSQGRAVTAWRRLLPSESALAARAPLLTFAVVYAITCLVGALVMMVGFHDFDALYRYFSGTSVAHLDSGQRLTDLTLLVIAPLLLWLGYELALRTRISSRTIRADRGVGHPSTEARLDTPDWLPLLVFYGLAAVAFVSLAHAGSFSELSAWGDYKALIAARTRAFDQLRFIEFVNIYVLVPVAAAWVVVSHTQRGKVGGLRRWAPVLVMLAIDLLVFQKKIAVSSLLIVGFAWLCANRPRSGRLRKRRAIFAAIGVTVIYFAALVAPVLSHSSGSLCTVPGIKCQGPAKAVPAVAAYAFLAPLTRTSGPALYYPVVFPGHHPFYPVRSALALDVLGIGTYPNDNQVVWNYLNHGVAGNYAAPFQFPLYSEGGLSVALIGSLVIGIVLGLVWRFVRSGRLPREWSALLGSMALLLAVYLALDSVRNGLIVSYGVGWGLLFLAVAATAVRYGNSTANAQRLRAALSPVGRVAGRATALAARSSGAIQARLPERSAANQEQTDPWPVLAAAVIGAGVALSGFPPLSGLMGALHVQALPGFTLAMPAVLLALLALAYVRSPIRRVPPLVVVALTLTCLAGCLSLSDSAHQDASASYLILGVFAPAALFLAVWLGGLSKAVLAGSFLSALVVLLVRADVAFVLGQGFPTPAALFAARFGSRAQDFHHYLLGNPDRAATFLLATFTLSLGWALSSEHSRAARAALHTATSVILITLVLLDVPLDLLLAVFVLVALLSWRARTGVRIAAVALSVLVAITLVVASPGGYLAHFFTTQASTGAQGGVSSVSEGWQTLIHHPLTGVGLGQFGGGSSVPAASSVIEAGAEMGIWGLVGVALMTILLPLALARRVRGLLAGRGSSTAESWFTLRNAALAAAAVYVLVTAVSAGADDGLFAGGVSVYGLTLGLCAAVGLAPALRTTPAPVPEAFRQGALQIPVRLQQSLASIGAGWLAYCVAWIPVAAWFISARVGPAIISGSRVVNLEQMTAASAHGYGPFVQMLGRGQFIPAGLGDDPGSYLVFPWLSRLVGTTSPQSVFRSVFVICLAVTVSVYPLFVRRLTRSKFAALISPVLMLVVFGFMTDYGFYWFPAVLTALCVPWLLILLRDRSAPLLALTVIAAIAGTTSMFRSGTGYGALIAAMLVCVLASRPWQRKLVGLALIAAAYALFSSGMLNVAYQARAQRMGSYPVSTAGVAGVYNWSQGSGEPLWHTVYIGLGVVKNPYGIKHVDAAASAYVHRVDPTAPYLGARYESILRRRVFQIAASNPGFVLHAETYKLRDEIADGLSKIPLLLIVLPIAAMVALRRRRGPGRAVVLLPVALVAFLPPLVSVPISAYEFPWLGLLGTATVLCATWLIGLCEERIRAAASARRLEMPTPELSRARPRTVARTDGPRPALALSAAGIGLESRMVPEIPRVGATLRAFASDLQTRTRVGSAARSPFPYLVAALVLCGFVARSVLHSLRIEGNGPPPVATLPFRASIPEQLRTWDPSALATRWQIDSSTTASSAGDTGVAVTTSRRNGDYALQSPPVMLGPGQYVVAVRGALNQGGMVLGVLDVQRQKWIDEGIFSGNSQPGRHTMQITFGVPATERVQVILSNWNPGAHPSKWWISEAVLATAPVTLAG